MDKIEKLIWTEDGIKSLEDIIQYISKDSIYYASNFAEKILGAIENLIDFPLMGRVVPEYNNSDIREVIYQDYRIVYQVSKNVIYIMLVVHGSKNLPVIIEAR
ncbi:MAG: type II toxin-antitoxin system RelE/ParE family toxin [Candidatus Desantisbacteria bacterium]